MTLSVSISSSSSESDSSDEDEDEPKKNNKKTAGVIKDEPNSRGDAQSGDKHRVSRFETPEDKKEDDKGIVLKLVNS